MESINQAKLLFVVILMLAFKYTEDHCYYISAWSKATGIKSDIIHKVEVTVLNILDHNLFVSQERFESFSTRIIQKINKLKIDLLQSVKISYASSNYSSSEEESKNDESALSIRCRKCFCKRKQDCIESASYKKRRMSEALTIDTNDTTLRDQNDTNNTSSFYTVPTTLYSYYKNKQPLTPPTPNTYPTTVPVQATTTNNNLLQVDSLIIPSTPPTSQTSIYEDMEREEEIKNSEEEEEDYEYEEDDDEEDDEELPKSHGTFNNSSMAFILNPDENKIQFDSGENIRKIQARTIPYRYHTPSPKYSYSYNNLKKVNLLEKKNEKTRTTASIVLPNTSPVGDVASVFPSLSMLSQPQRDSNTIEYTTNKPKSIGLQSLLNQNNTSNLKSIIIGESQNPISNLSKTNFMNIRNDDTNDENNCSYLNHLYSLTNDDLTKQNILLSIYNCYAMRNIRHYQI